MAEVLVGNDAFSKHTATTLYSRSNRKRTNGKHGLSSQTGRQDRGIRIPVLARHRGY